MRQIFDFFRDTSQWRWKMVAPNGSSCSQQKRASGTAATVAVIIPAAVEPRGERGKLAPDVVRVATTRSSPRNPAPPPLFTKFLDGRTGWLGKKVLP